MVDNFDIETDVELRMDKQLDAKESRCKGLLERKALRYSDNVFVYASEMTKLDGPFYCPECLCDVVVRKCSEKIDHFAHSVRQSPILRKRDAELHNRCRDEILEHLKITFPNGNWAAEREIPAKTKDQRRVVPDISGRIGTVPVAVEVQLSPYTIKRIFDKVVEYRKRASNLAVLYIVPLYEELGDMPFRPRLFEKYLHSIYYGRVYYWTPNCGAKLLPVHFSPSKRWIESSNWYDVELKEEISVGGFWLTYKTIKEPKCAELIDITKDFISKTREPFEPENINKRIPKCTIFHDNLNIWWDKDEYKNVKNQFEVLQEKPTFLTNYAYIDDYDSGCNELESESPE